MVGIYINLAVFSVFISTCFVLEETKSSFALDECFWKVKMVGSEETFTFQQIGQGKNSLEEFKKSLMHLNSMKVRMLVELI